MTDLIGRARIETGPLRYDGPFGRVRIIRTGEPANQFEADLDAAELLAAVTERGDVLIELETLCHPAIQLHDRIQLNAPNYPTERRIEGRVHAISWGGANGVAGKTMTITLAVPHDAINQLTETEEVSDGLTDHP